IHGASHSNRGSPFSSPITFAELQKFLIPRVLPPYRLSLAFHLLPKTIRLPGRPASYLIRLLKIFWFTALPLSFSSLRRLARLRRWLRSMATIPHSRSWPATTPLVERYTRVLPS